MARNARLRSKNRVYHIILRGNDGQDIFLNDEDKIKMMQILKDKKQDSAFFLYSFCFMSNHIHMIINENNDDISRILKRAATSFAFYFNKKYGRKGRVFQDRFKSEAIDNEKKLLSAIRFVHQNPIKAGVEEIDGYKWSSYREYTDKAGDLTDYTKILDIISNDRERALEEFISFSHKVIKDNFLDIADEKEIDKINVHDFVNRFLKDLNLKLEDLKKPESKKARDSIILYLLSSSNLSRRMIADILGINRETVRRAGLNRICNPDKMAI